MEANAVMEFHRLKQMETVEIYQKKFEELKSLVRKMNPGLTEEYLVKVFIGGLKEELSWAVKHLKPTTLKEAFEQAKLNEALHKSTFLTTKNTTTVPTKTITIGNNPPYTNTYPNITKPHLNSILKSKENLESAGNVVIGITQVTNANVRSYYTWFWQKWRQVRNQKRKRWWKRRKQPMKQ